MPRESPVKSSSDPTRKSSMCADSVTQAGHKRNLSNGTSGDSPVRRSKRQKSSANLKEPSSPETSETETEQVIIAPKKEAGSATALVDTPKKRGSAKKANTAPIIKSETTEDTKTVSNIAGGKPESVAKTEEADTDIKKEAKATPNKPQKKGKKATKEKDTETMPLAPRSQGLRMFVGAHVSAAKGVFNSIHNSVQIGGNALALFLKSQRKWDNPALLDDHRDQFRQLCAEHKYDAAKHILPHGSYLVNLAQNDKAKAKQAYDSFLDDLRRCEALGITLYNFHPGSSNQTPLPDALSRLASTLSQAISDTTTVVPVLETMCGHGSTIGGSLTEFRDLLALIPKEHHSRIGICIDTCHSFAAGYDLASPAGFKSFLTEFDELIGLHHLRALHLNDSKAPRASKRDLHANIGTGFLGLRAFHNVMNESRFEGLPMILETPIDRPHGQPASAADDGADGEDGSESDSAKTKKKKPAKKTPKRPAGATPPTVADPGVWAREIKLLESLIGMDPDGEEFRALEARLAEEGREVREKHQDQFERKLEAEEKKKAKASGKAQKSLMDMMKKGATEDEKKT
ncbi:Endodeoxyribonuclease IV [Penicillium alfredii]|uniref:Apurinic-apyrimidinic endonuclease 1 n=1 Tax=Penicillium alfredii TaxID=1506179 RepID=A0A9W9KCR0_9EURO|nr:Endodeoxyribonuclease IV [Penicillium alfredii]KAJ5101610.1 Endodeoxyribonuclease IV [Penicillium alfredii]